MPSLFGVPDTFQLCGLIPVYQVVKREDFPLESAKIHYDLSDVQMLANLTQTYTSYAKVEAEIRYVFPLPPDSSVCAFKAVIDGKRTIKGIVKEKAKAKAEYDQAVAEGKTAALLEQGNVEIFQVSLGNIRPKQTIEVDITYVSVISHDGNLDSLRLTFPTAIAPKYGNPPGGIFGGFGGNTYNRNRSKDVLDFSVAVEMTSHIKSITSPSHPIAMKLGESTLESSSEFDPRKARVSLSLPTALEKDIVLVLSCQGLDKPRCMVESFSPKAGSQEEYTDAYALTLVPRFELPPLPAQEYIFLVDRSGSMRGGKMDAVRSALQILLMSLPSRGTCFNLMSFGSQHSSLWPSSVTYSADSVKAASAHVDTMTANFGGTEIRAAIEAAFASRVARPNSEFTSTSVFILTDGEAYDLEGVKSAISDAVHKAKSEGLLLRVFCMGIGNSVSKAMCDQIARIGQGTAVFVGEQEKPDQKLMGLLRAARGAVVEDISIDWGVGDDSSDSDNQDFEMVSSEEDTLAEPAPISLFDESSTTYSDKAQTGPQAANVKLSPPPRIQQAPRTDSLPPLYPGFRASIFAIVRREGSEKPGPSKTVRVKGTVLGRPVILDVPVSETSKSTVESPVQVKTIHSLAARALIQSIEDKATTYMSDVDKAEVLRLAERYGLASSQTSFVAIDEDGKPVDVEVVPPSTDARFLGFSFKRFSSASGRGGGGPSPSFWAQSNLAGGGGTFGGPPSGASTFGGPPSSASVFGAAPTGASAFGAAPSGVSAYGAAPSGVSAFGAAGMNVFGNAPQAAPARMGAFGAPPGGGLFGAAHSPPVGAVLRARSIRGGVRNSSGLFGAAPSPPGGAVFGAASPPSQPGAQMAQMPPPPPPAPAPVMPDGRDRDRSEPMLVDDLAGTPWLSHGSRNVVDSLPDSSKSSPPSIETFARAQSFDGSFAGSPSLFQILVRQSQPPATPSSLGIAGAHNETIWCTLLCVAYLEIKFAADREVWSILVEKAMGFVGDTLQDAGMHDVGEKIQELKQAAHKCIV